MLINIGKDFSYAPGPRFEWMGAYSGEEFRKTLLAPAFEESLKTGASLSVDLDGTEGYGYSFLEEAFGGLVREHGFDKAKVLLISIISNEEPHWIEEIEGYIKKAQPKSEELLGQD